MPIFIRHVTRILLTVSDCVNLSCWTMLGHVLRFPENCPSVVSHTFTFEGSKMFKSRCRRHQTNLLNTIKCDLNNRNLKLDNMYDLYSLRDIAKNRGTWRNMYKDI